MSSLSLGETKKQEVTLIIRRMVAVAVAVVVAEAIVPASSP
jgi:uncharacterized membrane protein YgaE (UPF0421/DUF939 family)